MDFVFFTVDMASSSRPIRVPSHCQGVFLPLAAIVVAMMLRAWRQRRARATRSLNSKARGTLLTAMRISGRSAPSAKQVTQALMEPLERATKNYDGVRSLVFDLNVFKVGGRVQYSCGDVGTIIGFDEDEDFRVCTSSNRETVWFRERCVKYLSIGDRVRYSDGEIAEVEGFDPEGDLLVLKKNGSRGLWFLRNSTRVLSVGDRVHYVCGAMGTVKGFDEDGDVIVHKEDGKQSVWYTQNSREGLGPLGQALTEVPEALP
ncbi:unnamed protein product [Durusdinium trenchii]|uniref:RING-type E3 ubiquitin transferase n=1 Tax=Durusdinium trenchii TaxID=1381693 RepID=A0ABP0KV47_9DINO